MSKSYIKGYGSRNMSSIDRELYLGNVDKYNELMSILEQQIGQVTSRDDIINPYEIVDINLYRKSRAGQAAYQSDLQRALAYQAQQQASYDEWYNSPEQQALRDKEAGLNSDLLGLSGTEAPQTALPSGNPMEGILSNGQLALEGINSAMNVFQTVASVATLAAGLPNIGKQGELISAQTEAQKLANISAFESTVHNAISSKFATFHAAQTALGKAVDVASWFADDNNFSDILPSYAPSDDPMYQHALSRVRKGSESILAQAYQTNSSAESNQQSFARLLANPYANPNTVVMAGILEPLMNAVFEMEQNDAKFKSDEASFKSAAMSGVDAVETGKVWNDTMKSDLQAKLYQNVIDNAKSTVYSNLKKTYLSGPNSPAGHTASMLILGHYQSTVEGLLVNYLTRLLSKENLDALGDSFVIDTDSDPISNEGAIGWHPGRPTK